MSLHRSMAPVAAGLLCLVLLHPVAAQEEQPEPEEPQPAEPAEPAEAPAEPLERLIYVPYENLKTIFEKEGATAFLPYAEYLRLWEASRRLIESAVTPVPAVITSAHYTATIEKETARIAADLTVQVLGEPWVEVPVQFGEAAVGKLTSDTEDVLLRGTGDGTYALLLPSRGVHKIQLELVARIRTSPEGRTLELNVPPVGITTFELVVPQAEQTVEITPTLVLQPIEGGDEETRVKASLGSTGKIVARWHPRVGDRPDMELLASVTNHTLVSIEEGLVHTDTWLSHEVLRGQLQELRIAVAKGARILDVTADARIREWKVAEEEGRQIIAVQFLAGVEKQVTVEVHTERSLPAEAVAVSGMTEAEAFGIHTLDAVRESGQIAIRHGSELTLTVEQQQGLIRIDQEEAAERLRRPDAIYFRFYSPQHRLQISAEPVKPRITVQQTSELVFREDLLRLKAQLQYKVERAGVFELRLRVPEGLMIDSVDSDVLKRYDFNAGEGLLTVLLQEQRQGDIALAVTAHRELDPGAKETEQLLPLLEPLEVERETGRVVVYAPEGIEIITSDEELIGVQPEAAQPEQSRQQQAANTAQVRLAAAWTYSRRPVEIPVRTVRKPTRLTADVGTRIHMRQELVEVDTKLVYNIEYAGLDTFRFSVPEAVADRVQIRVDGDSSAAIKQKTRAAAEEGWVVWTVVLQRDVQGRQGLRVTYDLQPKSTEDAATASIAIEPLRPLGLEDRHGERIELVRTTGELTVVKDRSLAVSAKATGADVEPIDVRELKLLPQDGFVAYRYFKTPVLLELTAGKHEIQEVVETVIPRALVEVVVSRDGTLTYRCRYRMKSSERQRLRVDLPSGIEPLGILVDQQQVALEQSADPAPQGWESHYVNVARTKPSDEPFWLTILFRRSLGESPFDGTGGRLLFTLPLIGGAEGTGVAVQQLRHVVWIPESYALVGTPDDLSVEVQPRFTALLFNRADRPISPESLDQWIGGGSAGIVEFPVEGRVYSYTNLGGERDVVLKWWYMPLYALFISGALFLIAVVLRNTSWENKLGFLLVLAFLLGMYALFDASAALHLLAAAAYGLVAMLVFWLIHGVLAGARGGYRRPRVPQQGNIPAVIPPPGVFDTVVLGMNDSN